MEVNDKKTVEKEAGSLSKGLEGVVAAQTSLSLVDGQAGRLFYKGLEIGDLARFSTFEEICCLLFEGQLPKKSALEDFSRRLAAERHLPPEIHRLIESLPRKAHPMAVLRTAVSALALYDPDPDNLTREAILSKGLQLIARFPTLVAASDRLRNGKKPIPPRKDLNHATNFLYMLTGGEPSDDYARALDSYLVLLADHGLNASTFAARVTVATISDYYSAVTSAIGALKGDLHGSANRRAMEMFLEIGELSKAEPYVKNLLLNHKKVMGFGHRIYKTEDPRATIFRDIAKKICTGTPSEKWYRISEKVSEIVMREKKIYCNVDFYSASVLYTVGIPVDLFTTIFAMSRVAGWTAHIVEQLADNRLIRPEAQYVGPRNQPYIPLAER